MQPRGRTPGIGDTSSNGSPVPSPSPAFPLSTPLLPLALPLPLSLSLSHSPSYYPSSLPLLLLLPLFLNHIKQAAEAPKALNPGSVNSPRLGPKLQTEAEDDEDDSREAPRLCQMLLANCNLKGNSGVARRYLPGTAPQRRRRLVSGVSFRGHFVTLLASSMGRNPCVADVPVPQTTL